MKQEKKQEDETMVYDIGIQYIELHWHFWIGLATTIIINITIAILPPNVYHSDFTRWVILPFAPIILGALFFFGLGIIFYMLGWTV